MGAGAIRERVARAARRVRRGRGPGFRDDEVDQGSTLLPSPVADEVAAANALTAAWVRTHRDGNAAFSGVGCWVLLAMLVSGADGRAREELQSAVGLPAERARDAAASILAMVERLRKVQAAFGLWSQAVLDPQWVDGLPPGVVGALTGDPAADQARLYRWVAEATDGQLTALPLTLSAETRLVLASALTVRTDWIEPFDEVAADDRGPWTTRPVTWLGHATSQLERLRVAATEVGDLTLLQVPGMDDVDVHLVRADGQVGAGAVLAAAIAALGGGELRAGVDLPDGQPAPGVQAETVTSEMPGDRLDVRVPAFAVEASHDLLDHTEVLGLETATDRSQGHFPSISAEPLAVEQAAQDVTAEFSATGFRAAAVTAVGMMVGSAMPEPSTYRVRRVSVAFDEPFGFVATHRPSGLVLVTGWVHDPSGPASA